jgi:hypothetical protein
MVGAPGPVTKPPWAQVLVSLVTGRPMARTVGLPMITLSGGPTHIARSPMHETGRPMASTVGAPGPVIGPPTWGTGPVSMGHT